MAPSQAISSVCHVFDSATRSAKVATTPALGARHEQAYLLILHVVVRTSGQAQAGSELQTSTPLAILLATTINKRVGSRYQSSLQGGYLLDAARGKESCS